MRFLKDMFDNFLNKLFPKDDANSVRFDPEVNVSNVSAVAEVAPVATKSKPAKKPNKATKAAKTDKPKAKKKPNLKVEN